MKRVQANKETAYTDERQNKYYELEDSSWWFLHRANLFLLLINRYFDKSVMIYDIGGSNGFYTKNLQDNDYDTILVEPTIAACRNAQKRGVKNINNSMFQDITEAIPQFCLLDVLEHIENDSEFLKLLCDKLPQGGVGLIAVPAFMELWSSEDEIDGHFRRYYKASLLQLVNSSGFEILYYTYFFEFLWLPIFVFRHLKEKLLFVHTATQRTRAEEKRVANREFATPRGIVGIVLTKCMEHEYKKVFKQKHISFGSSFLVIVRKV